MKLIRNLEYLNEVIADSEKYVSHSGKTCYRTFGGLDYYFFLCCRFNIEPKVVSSGLSYEGQNEYIELDYCEHDIILHIKRIEVINENQVLKCAVVDKIPKGYHIWNIGEHSPKDIILLVRVDKNYHIEEKSIKAIFTEDAQVILRAVGIVGDSIKKMESYVKKNKDIFSKRMEKAIPLIKLIK